MVSAGAVHCAGGAASPEVSAADDDTDIDTCLCSTLNTFTDGGDGVIIETGFFVTGECLAADFQKNAFIFGFQWKNTSEILLINIIHDFSQNVKGGTGETSIFVKFHSPNPENHRFCVEFMTQRTKSGRFRILILADYTI